MQTLELLSPAKNLECGLAAIDHGADAVYIGARKYGARVEAGNSVADIKLLCDYAHKFLAKVYVTLNTIIYDGEMDDTLSLVGDLRDVGVDALLVQDMGLAWRLLDNGGLLLGNMALHASTQTDNRTAEKVEWLCDAGFSRVVLARELSRAEIAAIHAAVPDVEIEAFVHGALCVSYSGLCYASQYCFGRSANRGACAQFCRMKFNLLDSNGQMIVRGKYLLSLRDLCLIDQFEELAAAGVCSFKIEGRLKDVDYVKNVVAAYNGRLNEIVEKNPNKYRRASRGVSRVTFAADLRKTFNRGFTTYFFDGKRKRDIVSFNTPKSIGEHVGRVKEIRRNSIVVSGTASFANGDGLCFFDDTDELRGFRINRAEGNHLFPLSMPIGLRVGMALYRNNDEAFKKALSRKTAERKIPINMVLSAVDDGFKLDVASSGFGSSSATVRFERQIAQKPQRENIARQLAKLGDTPYECRDVEFLGGVDNYFIPSSILSEMRRRAIGGLHPMNVQTKTPAEAVAEESGRVLDVWQKEYADSPYIYNVANADAAKFYAERGVFVEPKAFELGGGIGVAEPLLMQCRHCIRYSLGCCVKRGGKKPSWREPLFLQLGDGRFFRLQFSCSECVMKVYGTSKKRVK